MDRTWMLNLLTECTGDDIWPLDYCRQRRIPENWIDELRDAYETGFDSPTNMIFFRGEIVNQFEGIRDVDIASKIAANWPLPIGKLAETAWSRADLVNKIKEAIEEE
jgi:hypothetical protein